MARRLRTAVAVHTPKGTVWLSAGQSPSADVAALITAPDAWEDDVTVSDSHDDDGAGTDRIEAPVDDDDPAEPPRSGPGSGIDAWRSYAEALGIETGPDMSRDDIIAAVTER